MVATPLSTTLNFDARSAMVDIEAAPNVQSPELVAQVVDCMNAGVDADNAFHVQLDQDGRLSWTTEDDGKPVRHDVEPMPTQAQRLDTGFIRMLPVASQL
jgi:uncharacterized NAD-dependent epimerase/dehydratase family protein